MSRAEETASEAGSEQDWEQIFSPGGSKVATPPGNPAASATAAAAALGVKLRRSGSSGAGGIKDGGSDGAGKEAGKIEPAMPGPLSPLTKVKDPPPAAAPAATPMSPLSLSPEQLKAIMTESMVAATHIFASTQKQTNYQGSPGGTIDEGALSGATAGAPRLNAARSLDYLQDTNRTNPIQLQTGGSRSALGQVDGEGNEQAHRERHVRRSR